MVRKAVKWPGVIVAAKGMQEIVLDEEEETKGKAKKK